MTHNCAAIGCHKQVAASMLMCRAHWYQVPLPLRNLVWAAFRNYETACKRSSSKIQAEMLDKLRTAQDAAVSAVARAEKGEEPRKAGRNQEGIDDGIADV